jgi:hypothetical protein
VSSARRGEQVSVKSRHCATRRAAAASSRTARVRPGFDGQRRDLAEVSQVLGHQRAPATSSGVASRSFSSGGQVPVLPSLASRSVTRGSTRRSEKSDARIDRDEQRFAAAGFRRLSFVEDADEVEAGFGLALFDADPRCLADARGAPHGRSRCGRGRRCDRGRCGCMRGRCGCMRGRGCERGRRGCVRADGSGRNGGDRRGRVRVSRERCGRLRCRRSASYRQLARTGELVAAELRRARGLRTRARRRRAWRYACGCRCRWAAGLVEGWAREKERGFVGRARVGGGSRAGRDFVRAQRGFFARAGRGRFRRLR